MQSVRMKPAKETEGTGVDEWTQLRRYMEDAGCGEHSIRKAEALCASGARDELIRCLRLCRCEQLDALHEKQRQLDRLDLLIREAQQL